MRYLFLPLVASVMMFSSVQRASASCLAEAAEFAQRICGEVKTRGSSSLVSANGELNAEAKGLIKQFLGSAGGALQGQTETAAYENVLREQLGAELVNVRQCGIQMAKAAMDQVCVKAPTYRTCQNPAFGTKGWANQMTVQGTSGWRGGGYNQGAYCSEFTNGVIASRGLGNQPHLVDDVKSGEESRRTGFMNSVAEYNYHCSITVHWSPVYNERADPLCGLE